MADQDDFGRCIEAVADEVLGSPRRRVRRTDKEGREHIELRYRANDSLVVNVTGGGWYDHVKKDGGGVLDLLRVHAGLEDREALDWLRDKGHLRPREMVAGRMKGGTLSTSASTVTPQAKPVLEATYDYVDEGGEVLFRVLRYQPKRFLQQRPDKDARGGWAWGVKGVRQVPYRLPALIEAVAQDRIVLVVEGEKKVDALAEIGVVATCNAGGSKKWQASFDAYLRGARVVILPDNDEPGRDHRDQVVGMLTGVAASIQVLDLPGLGPKHDIVNWIGAGGTAEELWSLIQAAPLAEAPMPAAEPSEPTGTDADHPRATSPDTLLLGVSFDGDALPDAPRYLVKHLLPAEGVVIVGGQSGAAKTFLVIDLAVSLATGQPFFGRRVSERVGTLILAAEGAGTMPGRITAARIDRTKEDRLPIAWLGAVPNLADAASVAALQPMIQAVDSRFQEQFGLRLGCIVIDTLAAAFALRDENDAAEAQQALRHMRMLGEPIGALVLPVHHYGKTEDSGLRGSSAYRGGADAVLSVLAERNQATGEVGARSLNLAKTRYGEEGPVAGFTLRFVQLGLDEDDEPYGACVVEPALDADAAPRERPQRDPLPIIALKGAFDETMIAHGREVRVRGNGPLVRAVTVEEIRPEFRRRYATGETVDEKVANRVRQALKRALDGCSKHGFHTAAWDGQEWLWKLTP